MYRVLVLCTCTRTVHLYLYFALLLVLLLNASLPLNRLGDVYAYALTVWETAVRRHPWTDSDGRRLASSEIMLRAFAGGRPETPAEARATAPGLFAVVDACWRQEAPLRPSFKQVGEMLDQQQQ